MTSVHCIVLTTFDDESVARRVIDALLDRRLAACIQVLPIESHYRWQGSVQRDAERLAVIKTRRALADEVERCILEHHSYETPEVIMLPIEGGSAAYLRWLDDECALSDE